MQKIWSLTVFLQKTHSHLKQPLNLLTLLDEHGRLSLSFIFLRIIKQHLIQKHMKLLFHFHSNLIHNYYLFILCLDLTIKDHIKFLDQGFLRVFKFILFIQLKLILDSNHHAYKEFDHRLKRKQVKS